MSDVKEVHPEEVEESELIPVCNNCNEPIMRQITKHTTFSDGSTHAYQIVSGHFIQLLDENGVEKGPRWGFCLPCVEQGIKELPLPYLEG